MKKTFLILSTVSIFLGIGYLILAHTKVGKNILINWLLKQWEKEAATIGDDFDKQMIALALSQKTPKEVYDIAHYQLLDKVREWHSKKSFQYYQKQKKLHGKINPRRLSNAIMGFDVFKQEQLN